MKISQIHLLLCLCLVGTRSGPAAEMPRPNGLFIIADDLNDWVGPWGDSGYHLGQKEQLARQGPATTPGVSPAENAGDNYE